MTATRRRQINGNGFSHRAGSFHQPFGEKVVASHAAAVTAYITLEKKSQKEIHNR